MAGVATKTAGSGEFCARKSGKRLWSFKRDIEYEIGIIHGMKRGNRYILVTVM